MTALHNFCRLLVDFMNKRRLFSIFIPALLWGDIHEAQAAPVTRTYIPTKAMQRLQEQNRQNEARIRAIRQQQMQQMQQNAAVQNQKTAAKKLTPSSASAEAKKQTASNTRIRYIWYQNRRFVMLQDMAKYYGMTLNYYRSGIVLRSKKDTIRLFYDKRLAEINNTSMYLTHTPVLRGSSAYTDENDFLLVIDPVIRNTPLWKHNMRTILIDAGHGGKDKGAPGAGGLMEKNLNLMIAGKLAARLQKLGYRIIMTRNRDIQLSLQQRAEICEKVKPDLFISVHCNAVSNRAIKGVETFAMTPNGSASTSDKKPTSRTGPGNSFDKNNYRLAYEIQKNMIAMTKAEDRGVKHARFFVLRNAICPAVLVEVGFISNAVEGVNLSRSPYQDKIVTGIAAGIAAYVRAAGLTPRKKKQ